MEAKTVRVLALTAIAPIAWGSTYFVTSRYLPAQLPLTGAAIRALPAGLLLLALRPALPKGSWWWRAPLISVLTVGGFFVLIYLAGQRLPSGVASIMMASSALAMVLFAWALLGSRPTLRSLGGATLGILGVIPLVGGATLALDPVGVGASLLAMLSTSLGYVLTSRWQPPVPPITFAAWQLTFGGLMLLPVALAVEGLPPAFDATTLAGFAYLTLVATALAYVVWFTGLRELSPATIGLIGLLNPLSGALLGVLAGGERLSVAQAVGIALIAAGILIGITGKEPGRPTSAESPAAEEPVRPSLGPTARQSTG